MSTEASCSPLTCEISRTVEVLPSTQRLLEHFGGAHLIFAATYGPWCAFRCHGGFILPKVDCHISMTSGISRTVRIPPGTQRSEMHFGGTHLIFVATYGLQCTVKTRNGTNWTVDPDWERVPTRPLEILVIQEKRSWSFLYYVFCQGTRASVVTIVA